MSIEDIDYLKENSVKNNYIFFSDSKNRDKIAYPTPSEYTITFIQPFRNVYSIDILDASIPRTEYFVESYTNSITFQIANNSYTTVYVDVGNHNSLSLSDILTHTLIQNVNGIDVNIICTDVSSPASIRGTFKFECSMSFSFDMSRSTIAEILGFDQIANPTNENKYSWTPPVNGNYQIFNSINGFRDYETFFNGPSTLLSDKLYPLYDKNIICQKIYMGTTDGILTQISLPIGSLFKYAPTTDGFERYIQWYLYSHDKTNDAPLYILSSGDIYVSYINGNISNSPTLSTSDVVPGSITNSIFMDIINKNIVLIANTYYWFAFSYSTTTVSDYTDGTYGLYYDNSKNDGSIISNNTISKISHDGGDTWEVISQFENNSLNCNIAIYPINYVLTSPGLYSFVGQRYILLRCTEIDEHLLRSLSVGVNSLGLAKFKMGVLGFSDDRFDFSNVPEREFHPIGKLSRLSLRFERPDGTLYDFKGVNHTITFVIRYYTPTQKIKFTKSILNENYNADYVQYMNDKYTTREKLIRDEDNDIPDRDVIDYENEDDGIDDDEPDEIKNINKNFDKFNNFNNFRNVKYLNGITNRNLYDDNNPNNSDNIPNTINNNDDTDYSSSYDSDGSDDSNNSDIIDNKIRYYNTIR